MKLASGIKKSIELLCEELFSSLNQAKQVHIAFLGFMVDVVDFFL